jgi:hypothetical protein
MTLRQFRAALRRIDQLVHQKIRAYEKEHPEPASALSAKEKYRQIKHGQAKLRPYASLRQQGHATLFDAYQYAGEDRIQRHFEAYRQQRNPFLTAVYRQAGAIKDTLFRGDAEQALRLLKKFEGRPRHGGRGK